MASIIELMRDKKSKLIIEQSILFIIVNHMPLANPLAA
jgi:hypothetical protein